MMLSCRYEIGARGYLFELEDRGCGGGGYGADGFVYCGSEVWEVRIKVCKGLKGWSFFFPYFCAGWFCPVWVWRAGIRSRRGGLW